MDQPIPGRCNAKARSRKGGFCKKYPLKGQKRCKTHNGGAERRKGAANPNFKTGQYSELLPVRMLATYDDVRADPDLLNMSEQISLIKARIADVLKRVDSGESGKLWAELHTVHASIKQAQRDKDAPRVAMLMVDLGHLIDRGRGDWAAWETAIGLVDALGKTIEREQKRRVAMHDMMTTEQGTTMALALLEAVRRNVDDAAVQGRIADEFARLIGLGDLPGTEAAIPA